MARWKKEVSECLAVIVFAALCWWWVSIELKKSLPPIAKKQIGKNLN